MCGFSLFWAEYPHPPISRKFTRLGGAVSIFTYVEIRSPLPLGSGAGLGPGWGRPPRLASGARVGAARPGFAARAGPGSPAGVRGWVGPGCTSGVRRPGRAGVYPPRPLPGPGCTRRGFAARGGRGLPPGPAGVCPPGFAARGRPGRYARLSRRPVFARLLVTKKSQKDKKKISKT
ncbi:hypothetical protein SDC9_77811 [bioreactor metagenome]|uniref:Uncharacterized protein n=1 Tax=bioreactor metagenome TaxID=1076179 RepID=A0A644YRW1_9ZZZZ